MKPVFVTGANGNVGREVVAALRARDVPLVIGDRTLSKAESVTGQSFIHFDLLAPETFAPAVEQCGSVFLLRPPAISNMRTTLIPFIDAARAAGVEQIVFVSVAGADTNKIVPHHRVETHLKEGPQGWTILRPGFFAQNLESAYREDIVQDDRIYVPAGRGRISFVDTRDIAAVAVAALLDHSAHQGKAYTLTGSVALTFTEVARLLSVTVGRSIRYESASAAGYMLHLVRAGLPLAQALVQTVLHVGLRYGQAERVDPSLAQLLGRVPITMADYIRDHRDRWSVAF